MHSFVLDFHWCRSVSLMSNIFSVSKTTAFYIPLQTVNIYRNFLLNFLITHCRNFFFFVFANDHLEELPSGYTCMLLVNIPGH